MKKKFEMILALGCVGVACFTAGCATGSKLDEYQKQGYKVMVTYDANGGEFLGRDGVMIMDLFKPADYEKESDGKVHIQLTEPTDANRPTSSSDKVTLTKGGYFFAGWYETREMLKNEAGEVIDEQGVVLKESNGAYVYPDTNDSAMPAYTYDNHWDFATDKIVYSDEDDVVEMTLYAAWVPYYQFDYYYQKDGAWTLLQSTTFDYKTTNAEGSKTYDKDTIWIPDWKDGAMNHTYTYANGTNFEFPKIAGTTFKAAYLDEACTQKIEDEFVHSGTLDIEHGVAVNRVQNIYIEVEQGEWYKIQTAEQLSLHGNPAGIYEIQADLDFDKGDGSYWEWPAAFEANTFTGKFYSADGHNYKIKNATALHISSTATFGGLFGKVAAAAEIKNVTFENATFDLYATGVKLQDAEYGLFAGYIEEGASVSNVTLIAGTVRIGQVNWENGYSLNLVANGYVSGLQTTDKIKLQVYGMELMTSYYYAIDPTSVTVDEDFNVSMSAGYYDLTESSYDIEY